MYDRTGLSTKFVYGLRPCVFQTDDTKEDYSHLPPNQQKKKLNQKIESIRQSVAKETAERQVPYTVIAV